MRDACENERVDSLNYFNETVFSTPVYLSFLQPNKLFYLSNRCLFARHVVYDLY